VLHIRIHSLKVVVLRLRKRRHDADRSARIRIDRPCRGRHDNMRSHALHWSGLKHGRSAMEWCGVLRHVRPVRLRCYRIRNGSHRRQDRCGTDADRRSPC
jgi:hypothetical protein